MRILHIWDQAGVACILAKHHRMLGNDVVILKRSGYDPFGIFQFYGERLLDMDGKSFLKHAIKEAGNFDVVHVHSLYKILPDLRTKYRDKTLVLHYHGSEARRVKDHIQHLAEQASDAIVGSTADLLPYIGSNMIHIPNPVDTDHFKPPDISRQKNAKALMFRTTGADTEWVLQYLKDNGFDLDIKVVDRQSEPIPYAAMPAMLAEYSTYVDLKHVGGKLLQAPSKTALECLACGLRVLNYRLGFMDMLPEEHRPDTAGRKMLELYQKHHR